MTKRERILAIIVASTAPVMLVFAFGYWVLGSYNQKRTRISGLESQIRDQKLKADEIQNSNYRRMWYKEISLPSDLPVSRSDYKFLLTKMVENKLQKDGIIKLGKDAQPVKYKGRSTVFHKMTYSVSAKDTTLDKLVDFLFDFRSRKILHRIVKLHINPHDVRTGNEEKRTERLTVFITVEAIALVDAPEQRDFSKDARVLAKTIDEFKDVICFRDIFGLPNNAPRITTGTSQNFKEDETVDVSIKAIDDDGDKLTWEMISDDTGPSDLKLVKKGNSNIRLVGPKLPVGTVRRVKVKVTDNGCPAKSAIKDFVVRIERKSRPKVEVTEVKPPPPKFQHARGTRITGLTRARDGTKQILVYVGTKDISHRVKIGESFELDGFKWTVKSIDIDKDIVVINRDDEEFVYKGNDRTLFRPLPKTTSKKPKPSRFERPRTAGKSGTTQN